MKLFTISYSKIGIYVAIILCSSIGYLSTAKKLFAKPSPINYAREMLINQNGSIKRVLFPPEDNVKKALIGLINAETKHIYVAIYMFTDRDVAKALMDAKKRGIVIEIIADRSCAQTVWSKLRQLAQSGIPIYIWPQALQETRAIMHNKFIVFTSTIDNKTILWTGSYNFTRSASYSNQENVLVLDDVELAQIYIQKFKLLQQEAEHVGAAKFNTENSCNKPWPFACGEGAFCDSEARLVY